MKLYNIAADFKRDTIDSYADLNKRYKESKVIETYGNITVGNLFEGGRVYADIPKIDMPALADYIEYSKSKEIGFNYTINGSCMGNREFTAEGFSKMRSFIQDLYAAGVRRLTVALPSVIELIQSMGLDIEIKASIICQINNVNKAMDYKRMGVDRIVVDESCNRDFLTLKDIRDAFGEKTEIIANSLCHKDCIYRMFHYNQTAHDSVNKPGESIITYYNHRCMMKRAQDASNFLKLCWIRPEDIKHYHKIGIQYYKIQGRHTAFKGDPVRAMRAYFDEDYDGELIELLELFGHPYSFMVKLDNKKLDDYLKPFYENPGFCKKHCLSCRYCETFLYNRISQSETEAMNKLTMDFYNEFDEYMELLKTQPILNEEATQQAKQSSDAISFNF